MVSDMLDWMRRGSGMIGNKPGDCCLCVFSATANFVGSGGLAAMGVLTLTKVKHRRELLFAALPTMFAVHQFIEGFVWLGLDGFLSPAVTHGAGEAFVLYAQGLLPFLMPLSVLLFEPTACAPPQHAALRGSRRGDEHLHVMGADDVSAGDLCAGQQHCLHQPGYISHAASGTLRDCDVRIALLLEGERHGDLRGGEPADSAGGDGSEAVCVHLAVVRVCGGGERDRAGLLLEEPVYPALPLQRGDVTGEAYLPSVARSVAFSASSEARRSRRGASAGSSSSRV